MTTQKKPSYTSQPDGKSFGLRHAAAWGIACVALIVALGAAYALGRSHGAAPLGVEIVLPTPSPLKVQVTGAVNSPGLVELRRGDRVADAVESAGGSSPAADLSTLNLAAIVVDGMHIRVPVQVQSTGETGTETTAGQPRDDQSAESPNGDATLTPSGTSATSLININTASAARLTELPNIGPVRADAIVAHRESRGGFASVDELADVSGIGPATVDLLRPLVTAQ